MYEEHRGIVKPFTSDWCQDIKERHKNEIEKTNALCIDDKRSSIDPDFVEQYISQIERILQDPPPPCLFLHFDETGFSKRPGKGKIKNVLIKKGCPIKPF